MTPDELSDHYTTAEACLYDAYDQVSDDLLRDVADAFEDGASWRAALANATSRLLTRLADRPGEARLIFVEALRGDRELLRRRERGRQQMVALFLAEHRRRGDLDQLPEIQFEMLLGASFHIIANHVAAGQIDELPKLQTEFAELAELAGMFGPVAAAA